MEEKETNNSKNLAKANHAEHVFGDAPSVSESGRAAQDPSSPRHPPVVSERKTPGTGTHTRQTPGTGTQASSPETPTGALKPVRPQKAKPSLAPAPLVPKQENGPTVETSGPAAPPDPAAQLDAARERIAQLERDLKKSRKVSFHYKELFEKSPIGIYRTTPEGKIVLANEAAYTLLGYESLEELSKRRAEDNDPQNAQHRARFQERLESVGRVSGLEGAWIRSDGETIFIRENARAVKNDQGQVLFYEGTIEDISEHKRVAEELKKSFERLSRTFRGIVDVLSLTLEKRDPYAVGHQRRVAKLAEALSKTIGYDDAFNEGVEMAALLHDVGKIFIPAEILCKPGKLTTHEYALVRLHPSFGHEILKNLVFDRPIADIVHQHHEALDGTGYPLGLKGSDILPEARILVVADVVEAMSGKRPHRPSKSIEMALEFVQKHRDIKFDPIVVDACLYLFNKNGFTFDD